MPFLVGRHVSLLALSLLFYFVLPIVSQTPQNPAIGQELITFGGPSGTSRSLNTSNISVAQSQAFQTVYLYNSTDYLAKPLFDFKDACNGSTTLDDLQRWNGNGVNTLLGIQSRSKIALVQRGGNCTWSTKVRTVTQLSTSLQLGVQVMLIYDNQSITASSPPLPGYLLSPATGTTSPLPYSSTQVPSIYNISQMDDNDIKNQAVLLNQPDEIYFVSNDYGLDLLAALESTYSTATPNTKNAPSVYVFLVPLLMSFHWGATTGANSSPNYLSWVIALASLFFIAVLGLLIFFRWWRIRQRREEQAYNTMLEERNLIAMRRRKLKPLPVDIVNSYPIQNYHVDDIKNTSCAICLEDFEDNQPDVRVLPCGHGFCVLCIDPWLTQKSTLCPVCKFNCLPLELRDPEDVDEEANVEGAETTNDSVELDPNHHTPSAIPCVASSLTTSTLQTTTTPPHLSSANDQDRAVTDEKKSSTDGSTGEQNTPTSDEHSLGQKSPPDIEGETAPSSSQASPSPNPHSNIDNDDDDNNNNNNGPDKEKTPKLA